MTSLLVPDAGPLFSLAACNHLHLLAEFEVAITDAVFWETAGRASNSASSPEARAIAAFLDGHPDITIRETMVGTLARAAPRQRVRNLGELSIQSLLIDLRHSEPELDVIVVFEDAWFANHISHLPPNVQLLSTSAFLYAAPQRHSSC